MEFKKEEVLKNLEGLCSTFKGTLEEHKYLLAMQQWIKVQLDKAESVVESKAEG